MLTASRWPRTRYERISISARSEASLAATHVRHYYLARVRQREFWAKVVRGGVLWRALADFVGGLEREFSIRVPDSDLTPRKFDTIARIEAYLAAKR